MGKKSGKAEKTTTVSNNNSDEKLVSKYSQLGQDERCIYRAVKALEGMQGSGKGEELAGIVRKSGKVKEIDDEGAVVVLADHFGYDGPTYCSGATFQTMDLTPYKGSKMLVIITPNKVGHKFSGKTKSQLHDMLLDLNQTKGIAFHAIAVFINAQGGRTVVDKQKINVNGPNSGDTVLFWTK